MPALNFQKQFVAPVESGDKTHSIRGYRKRPFKVGDKLALYYGQRTRQCRLLFRTVVTKVEHIAMDKPFSKGVVSIMVDQAWLAPDECEALARRDGFESRQAMTAWWKKRHKLPFKGQIIHWQYPSEQQRKEACQQKTRQALPNSIGARRSNATACGVESRATSSSSTRSSAPAGQTAGSANAKTITAAKRAPAAPAKSARAATRSSVSRAATRAKTAQ